jgi:hypothetical protein
VLERVRQAIGKETGPVHYEIEKGHILRFAEAIGDPATQDPVSALIAPPTFLRSCLLPPPPVDYSAVTGLRKVLEGGSEWEFFRPVHAGDRIGVTARVLDVREREGRLGTMVITSTLATYRNQDDVVVATQRVHRIVY